MQLAGLVEGEWPDLARRSIFYSPSVLRELGWPSDTLRLDGVRAEFADLLRLPRKRLTVSTFALESDALVSASSLLDELARAALDARRGCARGGARLRARGARARSRGPPRPRRGRASVGGPATGRPRPARAALPWRDRWPSRPGLLADVARALPRLSVQVLCRRRVARRGAARRSVGPVTPRPRAVHPRRAAEVLRGMGSHRRRPDYRRDARPGQRGGDDGGRAAAAGARRRRRGPRAGSPLRHGDFHRAHRHRAGTGSGARGGTRGRTLARAPVRRRLRARARRRAGWTQRRGRPRRPAAGTPPARHRLQIGPRARRQTGAAGAGLRDVRPGIAARARSPAVDRSRKPRMWRLAAPSARSFRS